MFKTKLQVPTHIHNRKTNEIEQRNCTFIIKSWPFFRKKIWIGGITKTSEKFEDLTTNDLAICIASKSAHCVFLGMSVGSPFASLGGAKAAYVYV